MNTIAFIGGGNMASAIIGGLLKSGRAPGDILVLEPNAEQRSRLQRELQVITLEAPGSVLQRAGIVVWAIKPQSFKEAAAANLPHTNTALQFSVMAGIRSSDMAKALATQRIVRSMPNTPALIGQGIAGLYARDAVTADERKQIDKLMAPTGRTLWVNAEADLDAVTALSGSGPAYVFYFVEAMVQAAAEMGLSEEQGKQLALATFSGASALAQASPETPAVLRERVTSKGGTTYAALTSMEASGVKPAIVKALKAAQRRAGELGDEFGR
ncbi:MAG TPA: pyrroline-5-carboxylate reductase [Rhizobacter sp.]|nr:pyrroline-5-carboxylate reductase [Rhizobacter sp.]